MNGSGGRSRDGPVETTLYDLLNVKPSATTDEIKKVHLFGHKLLFCKMSDERK